MDKRIQDFNAASDFGDADLLLVSQNGKTLTVTGRKVKDLAAAGAKPYADAAREDADRAETAQAVAEQSEASAKNAQAAAESARNESVNAAAESKQFSEDSANLLTQNQDILNQNREIVVKTPYIGANGNWFVWNNTTGVFEDSGIQAQGEQGNNGVALEAYGIYAFNIDENGHLILSYTGEEQPDFFVNDNGHLIYNFE